MFRHRNQMCIARLVVGSMLFAQAALAFAGCDLARAAPVLAISTSQSQPLCHEEELATNANLCLAHCLSADQTYDTPQVVVHALSSAPVLNVAVAEGLAFLSATARYKLPRPAAPPPRILFQSFLI